MDFQPFVVLEHFGRTLTNGKLPPINQNNCKDSTLIFSCAFTNINNGWKLKDLNVKTGGAEADSVCQTLDGLMKLKGLIDSSDDFNKYLSTIKDNENHANGDFDINRNRYYQSPELIKDCHVKLTRFTLDVGNNIPDISPHSPNRKRAISNKSNQIHPASFGGKRICSSVVRDLQLHHKSASDEKCKSVDNKNKLCDAKLCNEIELSTLMNETFFKDFVILLDKLINHYNSLKTQNALYEQFKMQCQSCSVVIQRSQMIEDLVLKKNMWSHDKDVIVDIPHAVMMGIGSKRLIKSRFRRHRKKGRIPSISRKYISHFIDNQGQDLSHFTDSNKVSSICYTNTDLEKSPILDKVFDISIDYFTKLFNSSYGDVKSIGANSTDDLEESSPPCIHLTKRSSLDECKMQLNTLAQTSDIPAFLQLDDKCKELNKQQLQQSENSIKIDQPVVQNLPENHSESFLSHQIDFDEITVDNSITNPDSLIVKLPAIRYSKKSKRRLKRRGCEKSKKHIKDFENVVTKAMVHAIDVSGEEKEQSENTQEYFKLIVLDNNNVSPVKKEENNAKGNAQKTIPKNSQKRRRNMLPRKRRYTSKYSVLDKPDKFKVDISQKILDLATHNENIIAQCQNIIQEKMKQTAMAKVSMEVKNVDTSSEKSSSTLNVKRVKSPTVSNGKCEDKKELVAGKPSDKDTDITKVHLQVRISDSLTVRKLRNIEIISNSYVDCGEMKRKTNTLRIATN